MAAYCGMPLMAIAITGIILVIILYFEGEMAKRKNTVALATADDSEEELFND